jgi:hypothetical protein
MDVRLEDGTVVTNVPEGITQSELLARLGKSQKQDSPRKPIPDIPMSGMEKFLAKAPNWMSSDIPNRFAQGAADPTIGAAQLVTNIAANGRYAPLADKMNQFVKDRESTLPHGFDPIRLAGSFASPFAFASKIAPSATTMGRVYQGGMLGGASGLTNPVSRDDYAGSKMSDTLFGAAAGALLPLGWEALKAGGRVGRNVYDAIPFLGGEQGIKDIAGRMLNKAGGDKTDDILRQIELGQDSPVPGMQWNAGQKAAPVGSAEFSGLIDIARERAGSSKVAQDNAQKEAIRQFMQTVSKSDDPLARQKAMDQLNSITGPMREAALNNANLAGQLSPQLISEINQKTASKIGALQNYGQLAAESVQQQVRGNTLKDAFLGPKQMAPGAQNRARGAEYFDGAIDFGNVAQQRQREKALREFQLDSLAKHGNFPLRGDELFGQIQSKLSAPGDRASDAIVQGLTPIRDKIARLTDQNGVIHASDVYTIRKELNQDLQALAKSNNWDAGRLSSIEISVKKYIDDAIKKAGAGDLWETYLKTHGQGMRSVNDITISRELEKSLFSGSDKLTGASFQSAMDKAKQNPDVLRMVGAARMGNIEKAMSPPGYGVMASIENALKRNTQFDELAFAGRQKAADIAGIPHLPQTGILDTKIGLGRAALNAFIGKEHGKVLDQIAKATPEQIAEMMKNATPAQRQMLLDQFFRAQSAVSGQLPN